MQTTTETAPVQQPGRETPLTLEEALRLVFIERGDDYRYDSNGALCTYMRTTKTDSCMYGRAFILMGIPEEKIHPLEGFAVSEVMEALGIENDSYGIHDSAQTMQDSGLPYSSIRRFLEKEGVL